MPVVNATLFPAQGRVLVEVDFSDVSSVTCVRVRRIVTSTGAEQALRGYVYPCGEDGEYQHLSDGHAIFWDTEAPLDTPFYYIVDGAGWTDPNTPVVDTYSRVEATGWDRSDSQHTWLLNTAATSFAVTGGKGQTIHGVANTTDIAHIDTVSFSDLNIYADIVVDQLASGTALLPGVIGRVQDLSNYYATEIVVNTNQTVQVRLFKRVAAVTTTLVTSAAVAGLTHTTSRIFRVRFSIEGTTLSARVWDATLTEPSTWHAQITDTSLSAGGGVGARSNVPAGNTNSFPLTFRFDNYRAAPVTSSYQTGQLTLTSNGTNFWLKDPVRPCNDKLVKTTYVPSVCPPGTGIYFLSMDVENRESVAQAQVPTNSPQRLWVSDERLGVDSILTLATRTFTDRDAVIQLAQPGSPLLFQAPTGYGIPDRYLGVGPVGVARGLPNHRHQARIVTLPYQEVARPVGTTQGICGARFTDLCDVETTWAGLTDLTWGELLLGEAGAAGTVAFQDWSDVESGFATWAAVEANGTWGDVKAGT